MPGVTNKISADCSHLQNALYYIENNNDVPIPIWPENLNLIHFLQITVQILGTNWHFTETGKRL